MPPGPSTKTVSWKDVKAKLEDFDRMGLIALIRDLYNLDPANRTLLHTRFGLGKDALEPYKQILERYLWPDPFTRQDVSIVKAKKALADYKKASANPSGCAELAVFYCEQATGYCSDVGYQDENYFSALLGVFEQAFEILPSLPVPQRDDLLARLDDVRSAAHDFGYGVGEVMDSILANALDR